MLTNDKAITEDVHRVFTQLTGLGQTLNLKKLIQAPFNLHSSIVARIRNETDVASRGGEGHVIARMNSLVDPGVVSALYDASQAGVKVELVVRGICMLKAGVTGLSENIRVVSVLGRFLEHSRVFWFLNEGKQQLYLSSADWMPRNFFNRVEIGVPLEGDAHWNESRKSVWISTSKTIHFPGSLSPMEPTGESCLKSAVHQTMKRAMHSVRSSS